MRVTITHNDGFEIARTDVQKIVIEDTPILAHIDRQSLIERVNALLDQYEPKDARPI